jgi:putative iron-dependent peroxidase
MEFSMSGVQDVEAKPGAFAIFMVFKLLGGEKARAAVQTACGRLEALVKSQLNRFPDSEAGAVMGFGAEAWKTIFPELDVPDELEVFKEIKGERHTAPSTPGDLFFHLRASRMDVCQQLAGRIVQLLEGVVEFVDETQGFRNFDGRALIGFVDGTENPDSVEAAFYARINSDDFEASADEHDEPTAKAGQEDEKIDFDYGSYVFVQKYLHDLKAWEALPIEEQEKAIGRRKYDDYELDDDDKPQNAHVAVTNIQDDEGQELKIVRANMPFANPAKGEFGTYFAGYAGKFSTTRRMLENMFVGDPPGNTDRLLDFSRAVTGTLFFVPSPYLLGYLAEI